MNELTIPHTSIASQRDAIFRENIFGNPFDNCLKFSSFIDTLVVSVFERFCTDNSITLCATGSFGRNELAPLSDLNLLFLFNKTNGNIDIPEKVVLALAEYGLKTNYTALIISELPNIVVTNPYLFSSFFDARCLSNNNKMFAEFVNTLLGLLNHETRLSLFEAISNETLKRYTRYGETPNIVEPNVKMSKGGLRDISHVNRLYYIMHGRYPNQDTPNCLSLSFIQILESENFISTQESIRLTDSLHLLFQIRNTLHLAHGMRNDRFEFADQQRIANMLDYSNGYSELMPKYYKSAMQISRFNNMYVEYCKKQFGIESGEPIIKPLDSVFVLRGDKVYSTKTEDLTLSEILKGLYLAGIQGAKFDESLTNLVIRTVDDTDFVPYVKASQYFKMILEMPKNVGATLSFMNELGLLPIMIPQFDELNGFSQQGIYHCYTAGEHTIRAIRNIEKLYEQDSAQGILFRQLKNKRTLYLALLFHDIAKPVMIEGHEIFGAEFAESAMASLQYDEDEIAMVKYLVANHQLFQNTAFRRDLKSFDTLEYFTRLIPSKEHLILLYLHTLADLSAVNSKMWTNWKLDLLNDLYRQALLIFEESAPNPQASYSDITFDAEEIAKHSSNISVEDVNSHLKIMDDEFYTKLFTDEEIARHIESINSSEAVSVLFKETDEFTIITVISYDTPAILAKLCGVMLLNDITIHDARIFTRQDSVVIDTFKVTDSKSDDKIARSKYHRVADGFKLALIGNLPLEENIKNIKKSIFTLDRKIFKRSKPKFRILFNESKLYTIIDVFAPDKPGLLYHIAAKLDKLGLNVYFAKISTNGDEIEDAFYVLDLEKRKLAPSQYDFVRSELTALLNTVL